MRIARWIMPAALLGLFGPMTVVADDEKKIEVSDLPKVVVKAAKKAFPEAKIVGATKETEDGETIFEVEMMLDGKSIDLAIDDEGEIEEIEKEIEVEDLPSAVIKAARKKFAGGKIAKVEEVSDEDDVVVYELSIETKGGKTTEVVMSPNGKVLEGEDEDDEKAKKKDKDDDEKPEAKKKDKDDDDEKPKAKKKDKDDDEKAKKKDKDDDDDDKDES